MGCRESGCCRLESALDRARNRWSYEPEEEVADLAANYGYGLTRNHPFADGNKRTGFQIMYVFLGLNGWRIRQRMKKLSGSWKGSRPDP